MDNAVEKLYASILAGRAMHAYLLAGVDPALTESAARDAAALLLYGRAGDARLSSDPDYMEYEGSVSMGDFRDVIRPEIYRETFGKNGRVVVFLNAGLLSRMVQNAMLKVLEEPPENTTFILTGNEYGILPTIRSRCMTVRCAVSDPDEIVKRLAAMGASHDEARKCAVMSGCVLKRALRFYEDPDALKLRSAVHSALIAAMVGKPDFAFTKQKRDRADWLEANELALIFCHDLIRVSCGLSPEFCPDRSTELARLAERLSPGEICRTVDLLTENAERLMTVPSGGAAFDRLFAKAAEAYAERKQ